VALEEAVFHAPSIVVFDDLDVLIPSQAGPESDSKPDSVYHVRLAETIQDLLSCVLMQKAKVALLATAVSKHTLHESLTNSQGHHLFQKTLVLEPPTGKFRFNLVHMLLSNNSSVSAQTGEFEEQADHHVWAVATVRQTMLINNVTN
jgi:hypothetical protein